MRTQTNQNENQKPKQNQKNKIEELEGKLAQLTEKIESLTLLKVENQTTEVKKLSEVEKKIQNLTKKLSEDLPDKRREKISEKLASLKLQVETETKPVEETKVEKKIESLTEKLKSDLPEKRKVQIAEKIETLKAQLKPTVELKKTEEKELHWTEKRIKSLTEKLNDKDLPKEKKVKIAERLKEIKEKHLKPVEDSEKKLPEEKRIHWTQRRIAALTEKLNSDISQEKKEKISQRISEFKEKQKSEVVESTVEKKIKALTEKLNEKDLPEKKRERITEKIETLKIQMKSVQQEKEFNSVYPQLPVENEITLNIVVSKPEQRIAALTEKLNSNISEEKKQKISAKLASLTAQVKLKLEKENKPVRDEKVEKKITALTEKLKSDLPEKRKVQIAEKLASLKAQMKPATVEVIPKELNSKRKEKIQQLVEKLGNESIKYERKSIIASKLKELFDKMIEEESESKNEKKSFRSRHFNSQTVQ
jgi:hypothetical protein